MQNDIKHLEKILSRYDEETMGMEATDILYKALGQLVKIVVRQQSEIERLENRINQAVPELN